MGVLETSPHWRVADRGRRFGVGRPGSDTKLDLLAYPMDDYCAESETVVVRRAPVNGARQRGANFVKEYCVKRTQGEGVRDEA